MWLYYFQGFISKHKFEVKFRAYGVIKDVKAEPHTEHDEFIENEPQVKHKECVYREEIQAERDLVDHTNLVIPKWFYEVKRDDIS